MEHETYPRCSRGTCDPLLLLTVHSRPPMQRLAAAWSLLVTPQSGTVGVCRLVKIVDKGFSLARVHLRKPIITEPFVQTRCKNRTDNGIQGSLLEILLRIHDHDDPMPPSDAEKQLSASERTLLSQWIREGGVRSPFLKKRRMVF